MGLNVVLEDERGETIRRIDDPQDRLVRLLSKAAQDDAAGDRYVFLRYIDPYQDTTFNQLQMAPLIRDLERVASEAGTAERTILAAVLDLAGECAAEPHLYLKFYGD